MNKKLQKNVMRWVLGSSLTVLSNLSSAQTVVDICPDQATRNEIHGLLTIALKDAQTADNGGFGFHMWAVVVNRDGLVCAVTHSGNDRGDQWPGSRVIAAQKANTANAFSLPSFALSTANLHQATQDGGSLFGLQLSNPVNTEVAYAEPSTDYGTTNDPMLGKKIGGINVFGGGLGLYNSDGQLIGGLGVSGDSSCADHNIAWRVRHRAAADYVPSGPSPSGNDQIIYSGETGDDGAAGFEHPDCGHTEKSVAASLPITRQK